MGSSSADQGDGGFATPAATVISLALAISASALTASGVMELGLARSDLARAHADYALAGAGQEAALALLNAKQEARLTWKSASNLGAVTILAEPQSLKLSLTGAIKLDAATLARMGVADAPQLRQRLRTQSDRDSSDFDVETADSAPLWRACARSLISPYGRATSANLTKPTAPTPGPTGWRIGDVWRIRLTAANGWADDRVVRFTGDLYHPAAVVERRLTRTNQGEGACDKVLVVNPSA